MDLAAVCQSVITNMERVGSIKRCRLARHAAHFAGGLDSEVAVVSLLAPVRGELKRAQRGQALVRVRVRVRAAAPPWLGVGSGLGFGLGGLTL